MNKRVLVIVALCALAPVTHAVDGKASNDPGDVAAVRAAFTALNQAADKRDVNAMNSLFAKDATFVDSSGFTDGWDTYRTANLDRQYATLATDQHLTTVLSVRTENNVGVVVFRYSVKAMVNGQSTDIFGYGTTIFRKDAGSGAWQAMHSQNAGRVRRAYDPPAGQ